MALSLSDAFCVDRHRAAFRELVKQDVDILFANETEITSLYEENTFEAAAERARADVALAALTRSEAGSVILRGAETVAIAAEPTRVVDTTGAGDAYAAGFLAGLTAGKPLPVCGQIASHRRGGGDQPLRRAAAGGSEEAGGRCRLRLRPHDGPDFMVHSRRAATCRRNATKPPST